MTRRERTWLRRPLLAAAVVAAMAAAGPVPHAGATTEPARAERLNAAPQASGAEAAYPLNYTFDADGATAGTPPPNFDFEEPSAASGTPPANHDLTAAPVDTGTPPANHRFEATPDLSGWSVAGAAAIGVDATHGRYATLGSGATITSSAFTVAATADAFLFEAGYLTAAGASRARVYVLSGPTYGTQTLVGEASCTGCNAWQTVALPATAYRGQSVKLKFERYLGDISIDAVRTGTLLPGWETAGVVGRATESGGNVYADLGEGGAATTAALSVDSATQAITLRARGLTSGTDQYYVSVLSGAGFATATRVVIQSSAADAWQTVSLDAGPWRGQQIKLRVERQSGRVGVDDAGVQGTTVPQWQVTEDTRLEPGGPTGAYVSTNGAITSAAFQLGSGAQQITLLHKAGSSPATFAFELLRGATFSQVVDLAGNVASDATQWKTLTAAVGQYAGETVKLRVRQTWGRILVDRVGAGESVLPGWTLVGTNPIVTGEDVHGTYITSASSGGVRVRSATIQSGVLDGPRANDARYVAISYDIGSMASDILRVYWTDSVGQEHVVFSTSASTPTGYRTQYFPIYDRMGQTGTLTVNIAGKGKVYSIADNIARQQLAEPFAQKVGAQIDTSTGAFGYQARDVVCQ